MYTQKTPWQPLGHIPQLPIKFLLPMDCENFYFPSLAGEIEDTAKRNIVIITANPKFKFLRSLFLNFNRKIQCTVYVLLRNRLHKEVHGLRLE